ncbi:epithelial cell-transforming sequence 2 oncogene-like [Mugil cephalus]|uniref:epithelial cell-transforming sequence 2 oncogene-like n=1 Tax=Mugil cephalus TaxID=48193 RepID=UPI001FB6298A|nr:epithelial cell-transforming sequence 2 oncogene-like [Mugil cephalus]
MESRLKSAPHSVKRWQLSGTDYEPEQARNQRSHTRLSTWTPLNNKQGNIQLFEERVNLVLHWFDLWSDGQRKHLLLSLLARCTKPQLECCRDSLTEALPVTRADFAAVLPRFLSLYVMSFLTPRDLCSAARVSWHWRLLAEQDCLWVGRCVGRGWFLPYAPGEKEFGAWKGHYVSCVSALDLLAPREAAELYGALDRPSADAAQEEEERRRRERRTRQRIRDKLQEEKRVCMRTRRAWGSYSKPEGTRGSRPSSGSTLLSWPPQSAASSRLLVSGRAVTSAPSLEPVQASGLGSERPTKAGAALSSSSSTRGPAPPRSVSPMHRAAAPPPLLLLLLVSNRLPAYELVLSGVKAGVLAVLYDHRGTLPALLAQVQRAVSGRTALKLGLLAPGGTEEIHLLHGCRLSERTLLNPDHRDFWEKLCGWVAQSDEGGGIDVFSPLAASASGVSLIRKLSTLTGLEVRAPAGLATGSFQSILGEWSDGGVCAELLYQPPSSPAVQYVCERVLQSWCTQAHWMEEALRAVKSSLGSALRRASLQAGGRALGYFAWEEVCLDKICVSKDLSEALTEGLAALTRREETRPLEFLSAFLSRWSQGEGGQECLKETPEPPQTALDWRGAAARELHHSERLYVARLSAVVKVYEEPLTAALNSNRAILSFNDIRIILSPVTLILELNRVFLSDLGSRLQQWDADQCIGDVFVKLCSKLRVYTNYLNNYTTALLTVDKCRETKPAFRAFLKRVDRTLPTHMLSLEELLLCPVWRIQEYVTLLQAASLHTPPGHPDVTHLRSALSTLQRLRDFTQKLKRNSEADTLIKETQQMIQGCPNLSEGNRQLLITQEAALLISPDGQIPDSLRTYEHVSDVGLFLFSDALVLTRRSVRHTPFTLAHQSAHRFLASVALSSLSVREITHTRYVRHAFVLEGPCRSWVVATETGEEREHFLSVLRSAISSALSRHQ